MNAKNNKATKRKLLVVLVVLDLLALGLDTARLVKLVRGGKA